MVQFLAMAAMAAACGSSSSDHKTCADACANLFACGAKLGVTVSSFFPAQYAAYYTSAQTCTNRCMSGDCPNTQQVVDCGASLACNTLMQVVNDATACFNNAGCTP
jgi:hypothetical protein